MEFEADAVSLRLLASAGIDPREAVRFWEGRLQNQAPLKRPTEPRAGDLFGRLKMHSAAEPRDYFPSHPVDATRLQRIKKELGGWVTRPSRWFTFF
jgi:predicted Zn-dependent protease